MNDLCKKCGWHVAQCECEENKKRQIQRRKKIMKLENKIIGTILTITILWICYLTFKAIAHYKMEHLWYKEHIRNEERYYP